MQFFYFNPDPKLALTAIIIQIPIDMFPGGPIYSSEKWPGNNTVTYDYEIWWLDEVQLSETTRIFSADKGIKAK